MSNRPVWSYTAPLLHLAAASNLPQPTALPWSARAAGALWGLFVGDALAMPVHWYYGGPDQIRTDFGHLLTGYERSVHPFPDSIMQLSNTGGGGRGSDEGDVVGGVILHDKKPYWRRGGQFHYHQTLDAGENTLEAVLAREMIRSLTSTGGRFSAEDFRQRYIDLMTTPGTHNDTYASTCHRMFFKKWRSGVAPEKCPDNDGHNVDTMDGLVLPSVVALAALVRGESLEDAAKQGSEALAVTRASRVLPQYVQIMTQFLSKLLHHAPLENAAQQIAEEVYGSNLSAVHREADPVVACYIGGSFPALLHFAYKYGSSSASDALLASANAGGENVHRNQVFGLLLGASQGKAGLNGFEEGLKSFQELDTEIAALIKVLKEPAGSPREL